ncbi:MAG: hypothetical protein JWP96_873 [Polaromonas sp.]|nr:hypothetical protein [Polaromonas sp.]
MSRLKERLLHPWSQHEDATAEAKTSLPIIAPERPVGFPSSIAEFLLVFRLKARRRSTFGTDILERAVRVVFVTCKHWFADAPHKPRPRKHD